MMRIELAYSARRHHKSTAHGNWSMSGLMNQSVISQPSTKANGAVRFRTLDGIRGVAALGVAAYHFGQRGDQFVSEGYLAVDLFFMLSGFVIALNYSDKITNGLGVAKFFQLRLLRLYPTYFVGTVLGIIRQVGGVLLGLPHSLSVMCPSSKHLAQIWRVGNGERASSGVGF